MSADSAVVVGGAVVVVIVTGAEVVAGCVVVEGASVVGATVVVVVVGVDTDSSPSEPHAASTTRAKTKRAERTRSPMTNGRCLVEAGV